MPVSSTSTKKRLGKTFSEHPRCYSAHPKRLDKIKGTYLGRQDRRSLSHQDIATM
jgi:hypothetical protein